MKTLKKFLVAFLRWTAERGGLEEYVDLGPDEIGPAILASIASSVEGEGLLEEFGSEGYPGLSPADLELLRGLES